MINKETFERIDLKEVLQTPEKTIAYIEQRKSESGKAVIVGFIKSRDSSPDIKTVGLNEEEQFCGGFTIRDPNGEMDERLFIITKFLQRKQKEGQIEGFDFGKYLMRLPVKNEENEFEGEVTDQVAIFVSGNQNNVDKIHHELWHSIYEELEV